MMTPTPPSILAPTHSTTNSSSNTDCGPPMMPDHAIASTINGTVYQSFVEFTCEEGYTLQGDNISKCLESGKWKAFNLSCSINDCGQPKIPDHALKLTTNGTVFQSFASFSCDTGYKLYGDNHSQCLEDGQWEPFNFNCSKNDCGHPTLPEHARVDTSNETVYQSIAMFSCDAGYTLHGDNTSRCLESSQWEGFNFTCSIKNCGSPKLPDYAAPANHNGTIYQSFVQFSCVRGYTLHGDNSSQCLESGQWKRFNFSCIINDCGSTVHISNGQTNFSNGSTFLSEISFQCDTGYDLIGNDTSVCTADKTWQPPLPICKIKDCGQPPALENGSVNVTSTTFNHSVIYLCHPGYTTENATRISCTSEGVWDKSQPTCTDVDECSGSNECHYGAKCTNLIGTYECTCAEGYTDPDGNRGRRCKDIDECAFVGDFFCKSNWNQTRWCTNTDGSYYCSCNRGWTGRKCENDVYECDGGNPCGQNADCTNTVGSYNCSCRPGYPQGNPFHGCYSPVLLTFNSKAEIDGVRGDNEILPPVNIPGGRFPYLGQYFDLFRPSLNGFLALNYPPLYEAYGAENSTLWARYVDNHVVIAPLWTNLDSRNITGAGVWVHMFSNSTGNRSDILKIQEHVRKYPNNSEFNASVAFAVTWKHVTIHSPFMPGYRLYEHQNLSMQAIVVTDGLYTYLLFNYDQEEFSIKPDRYTPVAAGYTFPGDFTGKILANRSNFNDLKTGSNLGNLTGQWVHNVTKITQNMWDEVRCRKFHENEALRNWTREQQVNAYPCPCYEQDMKEDYTFKQNNSIHPNIDQYTNCYESWFFNPYEIRQRCCYRFGALASKYPGGIGAEYQNKTLNDVLETGFRQCCSATNSRRYCHLYYDINPPDDCSSWSPDDEPTDGVVGKTIKTVTSFLGFD
ncbi:sushi, von Willebrand factor type A, EGF and pentraxin domain-containing protein 1-like [Mya arenaria]|uniref:sushi, von Willebrand factor type A, EGF and pentraxin domain-containing protein 1-like n=1 Tax=Mya arenaria TaxID=6604 RepID=UPI0022DED0F9|nr:sushi, von Willebrand factor type A, EGF and pentraxin domain-containing protein 1-like [Mya arenaria]